MGDGFEFVCGSCGVREMVSFGCGFRGCQTPHYCDVCGKIDYEFIGFDREVDNEFKLRNLPRCPEHPGARMIELLEDGSAPCPRCGGTRTQDPDGDPLIWD